MTARSFFNMGSIDRAVRVIIGGVAISLVYVGPQSNWGWLGLIPLTTAAIGWCPLYSVLGILTRARTQAK